jgi:hypothetical protein
VLGLNVKSPGWFSNEINALEAKQQ